MAMINAFEYLVGLERRLRRQYRNVIMDRYGCARVDVIWAVDTLEVYALSEMSEWFLDRMMDTSAGGLSVDEYLSLMSAGIIARGIVRGQDSAEWFAGEAACAVHERDVRRAKSRAESLAKAVYENARGFVYGFYASDATQSLAADIGVEIVLVAPLCGVSAEAFVESEEIHAAE